MAALPGGLDRFKVNNVLWAGPLAGGYSAGELQKRLVQQSTPVFQAQQGQSLDLGNGARLETLAATRRGGVFLLEWGKFRALLPLGLDFESIAALMRDRSQPPVTAMLLADDEIQAIIREAFRPLRCVVEILPDRLMRFQVIKQWTRTAIYNEPGIPIETLREDRDLRDGNQTKMALLLNRLRPMQ